MNTDRFQHEGVSKDMLGYIIEVYPDGNYEVEFSNTSGISFAQIVASEEDLVPSPESQ